MRLALVGLLALALAGCDPGSTAPLAPAGEPTGAAALALRDALERIAPTLGKGPAAADLYAALAAAVEEPGPAALAAVESALVGLEAERPDAAVEADVIRLAVQAQP